MNTKLLEKMFEERLKERWLPWKKIFWRYLGVRLEEYQLAIGEPIWEIIKKFPRLKRLCIWLFEYELIKNRKHK